MNIENRADRPDMMHNIITFNGQGCSGKSTQSKLLSESKVKKYKRIYSYELREDFENKVYESLKRKNTCIKYLAPDVPDQTLHMVEVLGIPTLAWLTAHFYKKVKPRMSEGFIVVLDHYLGDYYAEMLAGVNIEKFRSFVREHLAIPDFDQGIHFYLDIDSVTIFLFLSEIYSCQRHPPYADFASDGFLLGWECPISHQHILLHKLLLWLLRQPPESVSLSNLRTNLKVT